MRCVLRAGVLLAILIRPAMADTLTFQQGVNGYTGTVDTYIDSALGSQATANPIVIDGSPVEQALIRFDEIFGSGANQIPVGATITSATLTLWVGTNTNDESANAVNFHRLLHTWAATDVWAAYGVSPWNTSGGIQADGVDAVSTAEATATMSTRGQSYAVNVTTSLQTWSANTSSNYGWVILPTGSDGLRLVSSEGATNQPLLTVVFTAGCTQNSQCDDGNPCTDDACNQTTHACEHTNNSATCSDGNPCTTDVCVNGACVGTPVSCPSGQTCNPATGVCEAQPVTVTFQEGLNSYAGTQDAHIQQYSPGTNFGTAAVVKWDTDEPAGAGTYSYGLFRFDNIFGSGANQIPIGATVSSATLTLYITNVTTTTMASLNQVAVDWTEASVTWNNFGAEAGVQVSDYGTLVGSVPLGTAVNTTVSINVTSSLQIWANSPNANRGWIIGPATTDGQECASSEATTQSQRPLLTVTYVAAAPCSSPQDCNDNNPCTTDTCENNVCVHANNTSTCDDGNPCTINDTCTAGTCAGTAKACPSGQTCDPATGACIGPVTLIGVNDTGWRYFKGTAEPTPTDLTAWTRQSFNQSTWAPGASNGTYSGFGYDYYVETGGTNSNGDYGSYIGTELSDMRRCTDSSNSPPLCNIPGYASVYIRREFNISNPTQITALTLKFYIDDGCVVYLNGQEVARVNITGSPPAYNALATGGPASGDVPPVNKTFDLTSYISLLVAGTNVLAIQAHNASLDSRDLLILTQLSATMAGNAPPNAPTNPAPADQAVGVPGNPTLSVTVTDAEADPMTVTFYGREVGSTSGQDFTIVHVTDTQFYSESSPQGLQTMMQWVASNRAARNIVHLELTGDITNVGTIESQWVNANTAISYLENTSLTGLTSGLPYGILPGNHDGAPDSAVLYNNYFGVSRFYGRPYYGGHYDADNDNNYTLFSASGMDFIAVNLEMQPSSVVLAWADSLLKSYSNRRAIVGSHYIMEVGEQAAFGSPGQQIYDALKNNSNLFLMLCGHMHGEGKRYDDYLGRRVWTMIADYQDVDSGVGGWLRLLRFSPVNNKIYVTSYSPTTGNYRTGSTSQFELDYAMDGSGPFTTIGTVQNVPSGGTASVGWPGRTADKSYQWYVTISDGTSVTTGPTWTFTSGGTCTVPADCDDGNVCTTDACVSETCVHTLVAGCCQVDGDCSDGNPCNGVETCVNGTCVAGTPVDCSSLNSDCSSGSCNPLTGLCESTSINEGGACEDGLACTSDDKCVAGHCVGTDTCTNGRVCDASGGIQHGGCVLPNPLVSFQEGVDGYVGIVDTYLRKGAPDVAYGQVDWIEWDQTEGTSGNDTVALIRFDNIFGSGLGKIPVGAAVTSATLTYYVQNTGDTGDVREVLIPWDETVTYNTFGTTPGAQPGDYGAQQVASAPGGSIGSYSIDVTSSLQKWAADPALNRGWIILWTAGNSVEASSSEAATVSNRPKLSVLFESRCVTDTDCSDGNPCTADSCDNGDCVYTPLTGNACDDGDLCTVSDACSSSGACVGTPKVCPSGQTCDRLTGDCVLAPTSEPLPIDPNDTWRYFKGTTAPPADWNALLFDDSAWLSGPGGFGYGSDCTAQRGTTLDDMLNGYVSIYTRRLFHVDDPDVISRLVLTVDYDDAFVAYINGQEVARRNVTGSPPAYTQLATADHECSVCNGTCNAAEAIDLSEYIEILADNSNVLAIQAHNLTSGSSDFTLVVSLTATMAPTCQIDSDCDDHNVCNGSETCVGGNCVAGILLNCDDGNACTSDTCDPASGCVHTAISCDDGNACTADACDTATGCEHTAIICDDGNACNGVETCNPASGCVPGTPLNCDDNNVCTSDTCNPVIGCTHTGTSCDDGIACTADSCDSVTGCHHVDNCSAGMECNHATGVCEAQAEISCALTQGSVAPGGSTVLTLHLTNGQNIRGYQTTIAITRTSGTGALTVNCPGGVAVNESASDYIFRGYSPTYPATNCGQRLASSSLLNGGVNVGTVPAYLSSYTLTMSGDAGPGSRFEISIVPSGTSLFDATPGNPQAIPFRISAVCLVTAEAGSGACCFLDGSCQEVAESACQQVGGIWHQGITCGTNPCLQPTGACCHTDGTCTTTTSADCEGAWQGVGSSCNSNPCPPPNDNCLSLTQVTEGSLNFDTTNATYDGPGWCMTDPSKNIWFCYTATTTGMATVTLSAGWSTMLAVYHDCTCYPAQAMMMCCHPTTCTISVQSGHGYLIEVGGIGTAAGSGTLTIAATTGCVINGTLYPPGASNPANECQVCNLALNAYDWSPSANGTICDDENACTTGDVCTNGTCAGTQISCDDGSSCTEDTCDPVLGCRHINITGPCDDGNACTANDLCTNGICAGTPISCDDGNVCTDDTCDPVLGCQHINNTASCDDGNACTQTDTCQDGTCVGSNEVVCHASDQCHEAGVCDPQSGTCSNPAKANGSMCDDGDACTQTDTCQGGACVGANRVVCTASDQCHDAGACNPATGTCSNPAKPNGSACNDGDACTTGDTCVNGACAGGAALNCNDGNACTNDSCDPGTGCVHIAVANGTPCSDGAFCTKTDTCQSGACVGGGDSPCDAVCERCSETADACEHCMFDLQEDGYGVIGGGDFSIFAGDYGACYPAGNVHLRSNFDGSSNGCVGGGDFAVFSACYAQTCGQCVNCFGPGRDGGADQGAEDVQARIALVAVGRPTLQDIVSSLPVGLTSLTAGQIFHLEVWASGGRWNGGVEEGLASVYVEVRYHPSAVTVDSVASGMELGLFAMGLNDPQQGIVTVGGCASLGEGTLGTGQSWVRVGTLTMHGASPKKPSSALSDPSGVLWSGPASGPYGISIFNRFGDLPGTAVEFGSVQLRIRPR